MTSGTQRILVTGASGNVGRRLRMHLKNRAADVSYLMGSGRIPVLPEEHAVDLADSSKFRAIVETISPNVIIHLASLVGAACDANPARAEAVNVDALRHLARAASDVGVQRVVFASTAAVYGDRLTAPARESDPTDATSTYARTKLAGEQALVDESPTLSTVTLRLFNIYGESFTGSLVTRLRTSTSDEPVRLEGMDTFVRDYVHIDDVCDAFLLAARANLAEVATVLNIASGTALTNGELVAALCERRELHYTVARERRSYNYADISRARDILAFNPKRTLFE